MCNTYSAVRQQAEKSEVGQDPQKCSHVPRNNWELPPKKLSAWTPRHEDGDKAEQRKDFPVAGENEWLFWVRRMDRHDRTAFLAKQLLRSSEPYATRTRTGGDARWFNVGTTCVREVILSDFYLITMRAVYSLTFTQRSWLQAISE